MTAILNSSYVAVCAYESYKNDDPTTSSALINFLGERFTLHVIWIEQENQFLCIRFDVHEQGNNGFITVGYSLDKMLEAMIPGLQAESAAMIADLILSGDDGTVLDILTKFEKEGR